MAKSGLNPRFTAQRDNPTFEELARQVHFDRLPTWKNPKQGQQWINTLRDYAFPKIGRMPVDMRTFSAGKKVNCVQIRNR
ncbi:MAG: hypothetical protein ABJQ34_10955 [Paracoccaceae bacterium]|uniref:phage integrase central domain-containing protein n=1 Tax=Nonlabens ulvanivorans TaxID=906888 RepID=UPI003297C087